MDNEKMIKGKKYTFKMFMYYLTIKLQYIGPEYITSVVEVGINISSKLKNIIFFSKSVHFVKTDNGFKLKEQSKLQNLLKERYTIKFLFEITIR
jgi:hypothetical protein